MICSGCGKKEATVFYKQLVNNKISEQHLCLECAKGASVPSSPGLSALELLLSMGKPPAASSRQERAQCDGCGLPFSEFRKSGILGCPRCYESFSKPMADLLRQIHGAPPRHTGKAPSKALRARDEGRRAQEAARLRRQLEEALRGEDYEEAARLRDMLRRLA